MHRNYKTMFVIAGLGLLLQGCSLNRLLLNSASGFFEGGLSVLYEEDDLDIAEKFLANNLKMLEMLLSKDPQNQRLNLMAAQGFGAYAMAFVEDESPRRAGRLYLRGFKYALNALPPKLRFDAKITPDDLEQKLAQMQVKQVPALFWIGYNWGQYILQHLEDPRVLVNLAKVEFIMRRVLELDENYNFAGVHLFYGSFYAARPPILGGNPERGREHFERCLALNQGQLMMANVYFAKYYAVQVLDKKLFDRLLNEVLELDIDRYPQFRLMNSLAKRKAELLKTKAEIYWVEE